MMNIILWAGIVFAVITVILYLISLKVEPKKGEKAV